MDSVGPLRWCGRCLSRGWVRAFRVQPDGSRDETKALCPSCGGLSVPDVDALFVQAADQHWLRWRYRGADRSGWDEYDWVGERWVRDEDDARRSA